MTGTQKKAMQKYDLVGKCESFIGAKSDGDYYKCSDDEDLIDSILKDIELLESCQRVDSKLIDKHLKEIKQKDALLDECENLAQGYIKYLNTVINSYGLRSDDDACSEVKRAEDCQGNARELLTKLQARKGA